MIIYFKPALQTSTNYRALSRLKQQLALLIVDFLNGPFCPNIKLRSRYLQSIVQAQASTCPPLVAFLTGPVQISYCFGRFLPSVVQAHRSNLPALLLASHWARPRHTLVCTLVYSRFRPYSRSTLLPTCLVYKAHFQVLLQS